MEIPKCNNATIWCSETCVSALLKASKPEYNIEEREKKLILIKGWLYKYRIAQRIPASNKLPKKPDENDVISRTEYYILAEITIKGMIEDYNEKWAR